MKTETSEPTTETLKSIFELKAEAYDLIAQMEAYQTAVNHLQQLLVAKNQEINAHSENTNGS